MPLQLMACQVLVDAVLDSLFLEIAMGGVRVARRYRGGARTVLELSGVPSHTRTEVDQSPGPRQPGTRVIVDRWVLQLVQDFIESTRPSDVRAFIEEAVVTYINQLAATGPLRP